MTGLETAVAGLNVPVGHSGDISLLERPRRTLLVSRGERQPNPATPWLAAVIEATQKLSAQGEVLVTGTGRVPYDAALWTCARAGGAAIVALEGPPGPTDAWRSWLPERHLLVWPREGIREQAQRQRDLLMGMLAGSGYAIRVRKSGIMAEVEGLLVARHCPVVPWPCAKHRGTNRFATAGRADTEDSEKRQKNLSVASVAMPVSQPEAITAQPASPPDTEWDSLTHLTREPDGAWLGEERTQYLDWLCSGTPFVPRDAFATLQRILREKRLRACDRLIPGRRPMVCFAARPPSAWDSLRRWRKGLLRWTFSRYGLAVRRATLSALGARPVQYVEREALLRTPPAERAFMQRARTAVADWTAEAEWRVAGDVDLAPISPAELLAFVATPAEAEYVRAQFGVSARVSP